MLNHVVLLLTCLSILWEGKTYWFKYPQERKELCGGFPLAPRSSVTVEMLSKMVAFLGGDECGKCTFRGLPVGMTINKPAWEHILLWLVRED